MDNDADLLQPVSGNANVMNPRNQNQETTISGIPVPIYAEQVNPQEDVNAGLLRVRLDHKMRADPDLEPRAIFSVFFPPLGGRFLERLGFACCCSCQLTGTSGKIGLHSKDIILEKCANSPASNGYIISE
jgi:hypothetical protein